MHFFCIYSSFSDESVNEAATSSLGKELFKKEQEDLLADLKDIPRKACARRVSLLHSLGLLPHLG